MDTLPDYIVAGARFESRTGRPYRVKSVDAKAFVLERDTGSTVKVTLRALQKALARLDSGEEIHPQAPASRGGISYTVAITVGVMDVGLRDFARFDAEIKRYVRR